MSIPVLATYQIRAVLRKRQGCCTLDGILRTKRNRFHAYLHRIQMASLPSRDYFAVCPLVPAVSAELPRPGGDDARARIACRSHHNLPLGTTLRTTTGETLQTPYQDHERLVARRRDVYQSEKGLDVSVSRRGFSGKHFGIFAQPHKKCSSGQTLLLKSAC